RRCSGVCVGEETPQSHDARVANALAPLAIPRWPVTGAACVREASSDGERVDAHVFRDWCWVGTARDEGELGALAECPIRPTFDLDVTRLLIRRYRAGTLSLVPLTRQSEGNRSASRVCR